jgi:hypothetical protein
MRRRGELREDGDEYLWLKTWKENLKAARKNSETNEEYRILNLMGVECRDRGVYHLSIKYHNEQLKVR